MNCADTLEWLEAAELGHADAGDPEVIQARAHLAGCPACQHEWPAIKSWGLQLADTMPAISIPAGLRERLHAAVPISQPWPSSPAAVRSAPQRRRTYLLASALCLAMIAGLIQFWPRPTAPLSLAELQQGLSVELTDLPQFQGRFDVRLPASWVTAFEFDRTFVRGYPAQGTTSGSVALIPFQYPLAGQSEPARGRLLILPRSAFAEASASFVQRDFRQAQVQYFRGVPGAFLVWEEDELIFVCLMPGDPEHLARFQRSLITSRSLT